MQNIMNDLWMDFNHLSNQGLLNSPDEEDECIRYIIDRQKNLRELALNIMDKAQMDIYSHQLTGQYLFYSALSAEEIYKFFLHMNTVVNYLNNASMEQLKRKFA